MKDFKERIAEVSQYLQNLTEPAIFPEVQDAVEKKNKGMLVEICRKIKIPEIYRGTIVSVLLSTSPQQKWPAPEF